MERDTGTPPRNGRRERIPEAQPVGEGAEGVQSDVGYYASPTGFHDDATDEVTVQFGSALLCGDCWVSTTTVSPPGRAFPRTRRAQLNGRREDWGDTQGRSSPSSIRSKSQAEYQRMMTPCWEVWTHDQRNVTLRETPRIFTTRVPEFPYPRYVITEP